MRVKTPLLWCLPLLLLTLLLAACEPTSQVALSSGSYASDITIEEKDDGIHISYENIRPDSRWRPWPLRTNFRQHNSLRLVPLPGGAYVFEINFADEPVRRYCGNTEESRTEDYRAATHAWGRIATTDNLGGDYRALWEYVKERLPAHPESAGQSVIPAASALESSAVTDNKPGNVAISGSIDASVGEFIQGVSTATLTLNATDSHGNTVATGNVEWTITRVSSNTNQAVTTAFQSSLAGLSLGKAERLMPEVSYAYAPRADRVPAVTPVTKDISQSVTLSDIVGERVIEVSATTIIDGSPQTFIGTVAFGEGPLAVFRLPTPEGVGYALWALPIPIGRATSLPAAALCGADPAPADFQAWTGGDYSKQTNLPTAAELRTVTIYISPGASTAAGWDLFDYWTGELRDDLFVEVVPGSQSYLTAHGRMDARIVAVCRR